ncbi:MAG: hypothetical protein K1X67_25355 [Fimbriimonadaceae bacterium]|nr:hypothetical protein [Fimbriimonadaceae bacterium]
MLADILYAPHWSADRPMSMIAAFEALAGSAIPPPKNLLPLMPVDERSIAAVVCRPVGTQGTADLVEGTGAVVRWHLDPIPSEYQAALLDVDAWNYVDSIAHELNERPFAIRRVDEVTDRYKRDYVERGARPKPHVARPVQLACQNVILGLSVFAHDSSFDGLRVPAWTTCEVPHVATQEAVRALTALMLCDAYASGGTMEVRFGRAVPASLCRYARTIGLDIDGGTARLTPPQSRDLFLAVTQMPEGLRRRVEDYIADGVESPERLCYTLLAKIWEPIELDFLMGTSSRTPSILVGGSNLGDRPTRMAESEACRAALLLGMLYRRLDALDSAGSSAEARVFDDTSAGVSWDVIEEFGAVAFQDLPDDPLPWQRPGSQVRPEGGAFIALPRAHPSNADVETARMLSDSAKLPVCLAVPADRIDVVDCDLPVLACPDRVSELDATAERKLMSSRIARA